MRQVGGARLEEADFLAGFPMYIPGADISFVTTAPAPTTTSPQIDTGNMVALEPIQTLLPILVGRQSSGLSRAGPPFLKRSFTNITPWAMKQSSPILTNSQMKP
jgi:hypothetical protein